MARCCIVFAFHHARKEAIWKQEETRTEDDFEGWVNQSPHLGAAYISPAHWEPLPNERFPGSGGQGYCLGFSLEKKTRAIRVITFILHVHAILQ